MPATVELIDGDRLQKLPRVAQIGLSNGRIRVRRSNCESKEVIVSRVRAELYGRIVATQLLQGSSGGAPMRDHQGVSRRHVLGMAIAAGGFTLSGAVSSVFAQALKRTPGEILGPFYPVLRSVEKTAELTTLPGKPGRAAGQVIYVIPTRVTHDPSAARSQL